jgi:hypothetical protein
MEYRGKKHVLFICHSFQMACKHFGLAEIKGMTPHLVLWQCIKLKMDLQTLFYRIRGLLRYRFQRLSSRSTQIECFKRREQNNFFRKIRDHVQYERAIMAVRFTDYFVELNFILKQILLVLLHTLETRSKRKSKKWKEKKFRNMLEDLLDDDKIYRTNETLIPNFLRAAINDLMQTKKMMSN